MSGYCAPHASSRRDGRVDASARSWSHWERLVLLDSRAPLLRGSPRAVLVDPSGTRTIAVYDGYVLVLEPYGSRRFIGPDVGSWIVAADADGLLYGDGWHPWDGSATVAILAGGVFADAYFQWAVERTASSYGTVGLVAPVLEARQLIARLPGGRLARPSETGPLSAGPAVVVDGRAIIALADDTLICTDGQETTTLAEALSVSELSLCGDTIVTVDADRRHLRVHELDGSLRWSCPLPFPIRQPPLDGGNGRIYAVGHGLAALENGEVAWHVQSGRPLFATSLGPDGIVAAGGGRLDHFDHEGRPATTLEIPDGSRCCAPPAITVTGEIHLGTTTGLFVLR